MNLILIILLSVSIKTIHCAKFDAPLKLKNIICEYNETWIKGNTCIVKSHSRVKRTGEISAYVLRPIQKLHVVFNVFKRYSGWKPWVIYNVTVNGCDFLSGKKHNPYLNLIKNIIKQRTTFNHSCPYLPGLVQVSGLDLREISLGSLIIPSGEYRLDIHINLDPVINMAILTFVAEIWEKH